MIDRTRRAFLTRAGPAVIGVGLAGCLNSGVTDWTVDQTLPVAAATQYQGPGCDCCDRYAAYLDQHLEPTLDIIETDALAAVKEDFGVPTALYSCHTVVLDRYVIEGHIPVETIIMLFEATPELAGIALPGMPGGSPGMGGTKQSPWVIYGFLKDGSRSVFTEV